MCPGGQPVKGPDNWQSGFLPGVLQGTYIDSKHERVEELIENIRSGHATAAMQRRQLDMLSRLNAAHRADRHDPRLEARLQSFELAYRMQIEATDAFDVSREPKHVREAYGETVHGRQTLVARRLLERGVRYVQLWHGQGQPWDHHSDIEKSIRQHAGELDGPLAALLTDLKRLGMFDDTLVVWGGEFGRTPVSEGGTGRDHNPYGFTVWLAGGGVRGGTVPPTTSVSGRSTGRWKCTTCTPRSCTSSDSTTNGSPTAMPAATSASPTFTAALSATFWRNSNANRTVLATNLRLRWGQRTAMTAAANRAAAAAGSLTTITPPGSWPLATSDSTTRRRSVALPASRPPVSRSG
jgi:hypothetical protein